ncbi:hypothetical protein FACS189465_2480 [Clostridia bacterium]|nr:hypothetical protein FACS189465_2480 [Clostridia bacterium]
MEILLLIVNAPEFNVDLKTGSAGQTHYFCTTPLEEAYKCRDNNTWKTPSAKATGREIIQLLEEMSKGGDDEDEDEYKW